ncbi:TIR domain-containing protein [Thalassomonas actiniarum]|uniref:TIR domain-containing protein n=1 Tax=Thalassomonas actiniarum TaxID=485447 RepID=A0AAE9YLW7_9GAMM|nr:TIR domain-containing protein [Thalassomonas actiniarum]WDD97411.1 TIR domain-containing protein [Thalassomonas actiniarum]
MTNRIFVSYNFNDREISHSIKNFMQSHGGPVRGSFIFVENDVSAHGDTAIDKEIKDVMSGCDSAFFVVGDNNHNSPWINREADLAVSKGLKIVVTNLPNTYGGVPNLLRQIPHTKVKWKGSDIAEELNK